jgi:hypothetical protein
MVRDANELVAVGEAVAVIEGVDVAEGVCDGFMQAG